jgi:hypothetical protein
MRFWFNFISHLFANQVLGEVPSPSLSVLKSTLQNQASLGPGPTGKGGRGWRKYGRSHDGVNSTEIIINLNSCVVVVSTLYP